MGALKAAAGALARVEDGLLATLGLGLLLAAAAQLVFRLVGHGPVWLDPLMRSATLWLALMGALVATREGRQLHIDVLARRLQGVFGQLARVAVALFTAGVCAMLAHASYTLVLLERESATEIIAGVPNWWALLILPVVFALMSLHALGALTRPAAQELPH
jgi:TRAP-type C4-dicarboxylate transport system permease small subunit